MTIPLNPFAQSPTTRVRFIPEIDSELLPRLQQQAHDLDLVRRARAEGVENRPGKAEHELDTAQRDVVTVVGEGVNLLCQFLHDQLRRAKERIQARYPDRIDPQIACLEARASVKEAKLSHGDHLITASIDERRKRRQLIKFRRDHDLFRDASYASHWIIPLAVLFMMTAVEMAANAVLFAKSNPLGYAGGAFQALLLGVINVALAFCCGHLGLRFINHTKGLYKTLGFAVFLTTITLGVYWNAKVAVYRDMLEHNANAQFINRSSLLPSIDWISLSTIESWALLFLGLVIFTLAMLEGRGGRAGFADSFPGYRQVDLIHREADAHYLAGKDDYRAAVRAAIETARENLRNRVISDGPRITEAIEIADAAQIRAHEVRDSIAEWITMGGSLLRLYRQENRAVRTQPPPEYFSVYPNFSHVSDRIPDAADVQALAKEAERRHANNVDALARAETELVTLAMEEAEQFLADIDQIEDRADMRLKTEWTTESGDHQANLVQIPQIRRAK